MAIHNEIRFEDEICDHLSQNGWLYAGNNDTGYNRELALFPDDLTAWVRETQPEAWDTLSRNHGESAGRVLAERLRASLNKSGTLDVLRNGFDVLGLRDRIRTAQFRPALGMNPGITSRYEANRLRVVRQVHYSLHNENSIDVVLFLNGVPVATAELKTDFTQSVEDAVDQYRFRRDPNPKGQKPEPLLSFISGAIVHFAVSSSEVKMTTKLAGPHDTTFLPFNQGDNGSGRSGGAGNPPNPNGHKTAYLWENVWQRDGWLDILGRYVTTTRNEKKQTTAIIFPRYHQLDVTRKLLDAVRAEGAGGKYLVQHSAGSGKTMSIAWSAHFLSDLHNAADNKLFDSVIVVSDRNVIDGQLQEAILGLERSKGVVASIKGDSAGKGKELAAALSGDKKIVVCTIQTFPFALEKVRELAATEGKRFAVIADEAHSSQAGEAASKLKAVLSAEEISDLEDGGEFSTEDLLATQMASRAADTGITYVAFTATPKAKTLELFGSPGPDNLPTPFHVYSMRQAIEEGFILDVLRNYTPYKLAFRLAHEGKVVTEREVERGAAMKALMRWVSLHPYNIAQKVEIVVEHYQLMVKDLLEGKAKAMVVVGSRVEAVRWQLAIRKYIADNGYDIESLVAFSGEVNDPDSGPDVFRETSSELNPNLKSRDFREEFKEPRYNILLVANKFQTGFDQPLLCAMYVDKRLDGIQAVQTLSRLNRSYPGKEFTYVLDFRNEAGDILDAFRAYYETATLSDVTDPYLVVDLRTKLDATGYYEEHEIDRVANVVSDPNSRQRDLEAAIVPVADRLLKQYAAARADLSAAVDRGDADAEQKARDTMDALLLFKSDMTQYQRVYTFMSQIFDYGNTDFEKRTIFYKYLLRLLKFGREREEVDLSAVVLTHHTLRRRPKADMTLPGGEYPELEPLGEAGSGVVRERPKAFLAEIIEAVNELFHGDLTDSDKLVYVNNVIRGKLMESELLQKQAANNTKQQFASSPDLTRELLNAIISALDAHGAMSRQALDSEDVRAGLKRVLLGPARLYEGLRGEDG